MMVTLTKLWTLSLTGFLLAMSWNIDTAAAAEAKEDPLNISEQLDQLSDNLSFLKHTIYFTGQGSVTKGDYIKVFRAEESGALSQAFEINLPLYLSPFSLHDKERYERFKEKDIGDIASLSKLDKSILAEFDLYKKDVYQEGSLTRRAQLIVKFYQNTLSESTNLKSGIVFGPNSKFSAGYLHPIQEGYQAKYHNVSWRGLMSPPPLGQSGGFDSLPSSPVPHFNSPRREPTVANQRAVDLRLGSRDNQHFSRLMPICDAMAQRLDREQAENSLAGNDTPASQFNSWLEHLRNQTVCERMGEDDSVEQIAPLVMLVEQELSSDFEQLKTIIKAKRPAGIILAQTAAHFLKIIDDFEAQLPSAPGKVEDIDDICAALLPRKVPGLRDDLIKQMYEKCSRDARDRKQEREEATRTKSLFAYAKLRKLEAQLAERGQDLFSPNVHILPRTPEARASAHAMDPKYNTRYFSDDLRVSQAVEVPHPCFEHKEAALAKAEELDRCYGDLWGIYVNTNTPRDIYTGLLLGRQLHEQGLIDQRCPINYVTIHNNKLVTLSPNKLLQSLVQSKQFVDHFAQWNVPASDCRISLEAQNVAKATRAFLAQNPARYMEMFSHLFD